MAKYVKPVATNVEKLPTTDVALVITPPLSIPTKMLLHISLGTYSQTHLIRTLLIHHFWLIRQGNLKTLKPLPLTPMLNQPFN